jgi:hypothetical protein
VQRKIERARNRRKGLRMARNWRSYFANDSEDVDRDNLNPTFQK